jgi:hypothetical protein
LGWINDSRHAIPITNTIFLNNMIYDLILWFNHAMDQTQILEDDNITKSPIFCDEGKFWISYLVKQLNEEHKLMFDDIIYIGKNNCTMIHN